MSAETKRAACRVNIDKMTHVQAVVEVAKAYGDAFTRQSQSGKRIEQYRIDMEREIQNEDRLKIEVAELKKQLDELTA